MSSLTELWDSSCQRFPDRLALVGPTQRWTYAEADRRVDEIARRLSDLGVGPGVKVALFFAGEPASALAWFAVLRARGIVCPQNPDVSQRELEQTLSVVKPDLAVLGELSDEIVARIERLLPVLHLDPARADRARPIAKPPTPEPVLEDVAAILCTSGTTGLPKAVMLTHSNLVENVRALRAHKTWMEREVFGNPLPVFHVYGITVMTLVPISMGATVVRIPRVNPEACLAAIERERITRFAAVPSVFSMLNRYRGRARFDVSSCVSWISGGAPLPEAVVSEFEQCFQRNIHEGYGMLETSPGISWNLDDRPFRRGAVGRPLAGVEVEIRGAPGAVLAPGEHRKLGEIGEVWVRSPGVMKGYYGDPAATAETVQDGWLDTGDLGCFDGDGYLFLRGRKKEVMIVAGHKVYPTEIESVLLEDPTVSDAGVVAREDAARGDQVIAFVVPQEGVALDERALLERCRSTLSTYKVPRRILRVDAIPRNSTGKILRAQLLELLSAAGPSVSN